MPGRHDMEPMDIATSEGPHDESFGSQPSNRTLWVVAAAFAVAGAFAGSALTNLGNGSGVHVGGRPEGGAGGAAKSSSSAAWGVGTLGGRGRGKKGPPGEGGGGRTSGPREGSRDDDDDEEFDAYEDGIPYAPANDWAGDEEKGEKGEGASSPPVESSPAKKRHPAEEGKEEKRDDEEARTKAATPGDGRVRPRPPGADAASLRRPAPGGGDGTPRRYGPEHWGPDPHPSAPYPRIAWLMSFPNSGTSYTSKLVQSSTKTYTGSNYGDVNVLKEGRDGIGDKGRASGEIYGKKGTSVPVLESSPAGPFWADPSGKGLKKPNGGYVLTKTHCGAYCMNCGPSKYIITEHMFLKDCLSGKRTRAAGKKGGKVSLATEKTEYRPEIINRAVHLIRDPFDNVVSRYHLELNHMEKKATGSEDPKSEAKLALQKYTRDRDGFRSFCLDENERFAEEELGSRFVDEELGRLLRDVPCRADFLRYVRWHNLAFTAADNLRLPTLILHYEDYETRFNRTLTELADFLGQKIVAKPKAFEPGKRYREEYFTFEERGRVYELMKGYGYRKTWDALGRYFEEKETGRRRRGR